MKVGIIGSGYVGLISGVCFSEFGIEVVCVDKEKEKINQLQNGVCPIFEPGLEGLLKNNIAAGRLKFSTNLEFAIEGADAVFIAVGTPSRGGDGHADLSYVYNAAEEVSEVLDSYKVIVTKSTVPVGTGRQVKHLISKKRPKLDFDIASNPEFLRQGAAIEDFMRPDRVVIGTETKRAAEVLSELYRPLFLLETPIIQTNLETAELIKYAANTYLATKITFINEISDLCEKMGANVQDVAKGIGLDGRIGAKFLHAGPGFGGSCFPKDTLELVNTAKDAKAPIQIVEAVVKKNNQRKIQMVEKINKACGGTVKGKTIAVLGLTFKPNTDDMRESPSLVIVPGLQNEGAKVRAYDPQGMQKAASFFEDVEFCNNPYETMNEADVLVIITEWNAFRALDFDRVKQLLRQPIIVDLRNIYDLEEMKRTGITYHSIGRAVVRPKL